MTKKIQILLTASLLLNVLLAGVVLGHALHGWHGPHDMRSHWENSDAVKALPADKQALFTSSMDAMRQQGNAIRQQIRQAREETVTLLITDPFDEAAYQAKVQQVQMLRAQQGQLMADSVANLAKQLTPEERNVFKEMFKHPPFWGNGPKPGAGQ